MNSGLPHEILIEILVQLPAKSLMRFRSVSRWWNSLIASQEFISFHLSHSIKAHYPSIILRYYDASRQSAVYTMYHDDGESLTEVQELEFPIKTDIYCYICACYGLLCLSNYSIDNLSIDLWNPSIRTCYRLPVPTFNGKIKSKVIGLGFDYRSGQFKVLRLIYADYGDQFSPQVEVFVLGTSKWRRVDTPVPFVVLEYTAQAYLHNAIHWIGYRPNNSLMVIVVFYVHEDVFGDIELPNNIVYPDADLSLTVYEQSLYLIENLEESYMIFIWVMKQYGVKKSWIKQYNIDTDFEGGPNKVLGLRKHDKILAYNDFEELVSCDPNSESVEQIVEGKKQNEVMVPIGTEQRQINDMMIKSYELYEYLAVIPHMECLVFLKGINGSDGLANSNSSTGL